jgi:ABC-type microcin C transport system permease subunit YejE
MVVSDVGGSSLGLVVLGSIVGIIVGKVVGYIEGNLDGF